MCWRSRSINNNNPFANNETVNFGRVSRYVERKKLWERINELIYISSMIGHGFRLCRHPCNEIVHIWGFDVPRCGEACWRQYLNIRVTLFKSLSFHVVQHMQISRLTFQFKRKIPKNTRAPTWCQDWTQFSADKIEEIHISLLSSLKVFTRTKS